MAAVLAGSALPQPLDGKLNMSRLRPSAFGRAIGAVSLALVVLLAACGGGSGGGAPNQAPMAAAKLVGEAVLNAVTTFDISASKDPDGAIVSHSWVYGDGQSGSADSHVYTAVGNYTATLTVTDNSGASASSSVAVAVAKCSAQGTAAAALSPFPSVCVQTSLGELVFEVYPAQAPVTAANFLRYVDEGFYGGLLFHRVIPGFVIQAGGYAAGLVQKAPTHPAIALENNNGLKNWQYTLAMARTSQPDTATSQFFINLVDNHFLDYDPTLASANGYAVFGQVISGRPVVDAIGSVATRTVTSAGVPFSDVPVQDVVITSMVRMP
jgi:peptidyl-prolyl cis-trans isomerase A (cyclophilin A)